MKGVWEGYMIGWGEVSENHQGWVRMVIIQVNGDSELTPACSCRMYGGRAQQKSSGGFWNFSFKECCPTSPHPGARQLNSSFYVPGTFPAAVSPLTFMESLWAIESVFQPIRSMSGSTSILHLTCTESLLIFPAGYGVCFSFWHWCSWLESLV